MTAFQPGSPTYEAMQAEIEVSQMDAVGRLGVAIKRIAERDAKIERLREWSDRLQGDYEVMAALTKAKDAEIERLEEALQRIEQWSRAYPLKIFPEPDLKKARALLEAGGMTLDAISAHAMRHVVEGVGQIARRALEPKP